MQPLISCVVPVFDGEKHLGQTIDSILAQDYRPLEVIVVDDGSSDGSREVAAQFAPSVRLIESSRIGPAATRNRGLSEARGDFIAFLDQDDLWHREKLSHQAARFRSNPALSVCWSHVQLFWSEELAYEARHFADHPRAGPVPGYATTTMLARREVFETVGLIDERLWHADATDWVLRARHGGVVMEMMDEVLVYHRMHDRNLTRRRNAASREEFLDIVKATLDRRRDWALAPGRVSGR